MMKETINKWMKRLGIFVLPFLLVACGTGGNENGSSESADQAGNTENTGDKDHYVFGYTSMTQNNPFFITIEETMREKVEANGDELITTDPAMDVSLQINQIEDMISQGIDAIFLNPVDWEGIRPALQMLDDAGVKIINYDTEVADMDFVTSYVGSDNYNAGYVVGQDVVEKYPDGAKVIIVESAEINSIRTRVKGFEEAIADSDNIEVVARQDGRGDLQTSMQVTEDLLIANPDVDVIFGGNDPTALGALAAAQSQGFKPGEVAIYGVDGSPDLKGELAKGDTLIAGTGAQSPINIAETSVDVAYKILKGEDYEENIPVDTFLISKDNIADYDPEGWQ